MFINDSRLYLEFFTSFIQNVCYLCPTRSAKKLGHESNGRDNNLSDLYTLKKFTSSLYQSVTHTMYNLTHVCIVSSSDTNGTQRDQIIKTNTS